MPLLLPDFSRDGMSMLQSDHQQPHTPKVVVGTPRGLVEEVRDGTYWLCFIFSSCHYRFVPCSMFSNSLAIPGIKVSEKLLLRVILHHLIILIIRSFSNWDFIYNVVGTVKIQGATVPALQNCQSKNFKFEGAIKFSSNSLLPAATALDIPGRKLCALCQKQQMGLRHLWPTWGHVAVSLCCHIQHVHLLWSHGAFSISVWQEEGMVVTL